MSVSLLPFSEIFALALLGGLFSFLSTGLGSLIAPRLVARGESVRSTRRWLDFAMGVMLSSVAFSLLGPELLRALEPGDTSGMSLLTVLLGTALGMGFVWILQIVLEHPLVRRISGRELNADRSSGAKVLLALVLILHNFPEGMGAGASMAGMGLRDAIPLQAGLAVQNVVEGAILTLCFVGFGWTWSHAILGGLFSGLVEWSGAAMAGVGLQYSAALLSPLLAAAGGAMLMSVVIELREQNEAQMAPRLRPFLAGLALIPIMNFVLS